MIALPRVAFVGKRIFVATPEVYLLLWFFPVPSDGAEIGKRIPVVARLLPEVALVTAGVKPGERVVVTNLEQIADGSRVTLVEDAEHGTPSATNGGENGRR